MKDDAWAAFEQLNQWIRFADAKAAGLLATSGVLEGILLSRPSPSDSSVAVVRDTFLDLALCVGVACALASLSAMLPRLRVSKRRPQSLLYFSDIAHRYPRKPDEFVTAFASASRDDDLICREITAQIWANSVVAARKYRRITAGTWLIGLALVLAVVAIYLERV